jgi:hypothetical protein
MIKILVGARKYRRKNNFPKIPDMFRKLKKLRNICIVLQKYRFLDFFIHALKLKVLNYAFGTRILKHSRAVNSHLKATHFEENDKRKYFQLLK